MRFPASILKRASATAAVLLCGIAAQAPAAVFTNLQQFLDANPGLNLIDFQGIAPAGGVVVLPQPQQGVRFEGLGFTEYNANLVSVVDGPNTALGTTSDVALVNFTQGYLMRIMFDKLYAKVGLRFQIGRNGKSGRVRAYSNGTLVGEQTMVTAEDVGTFVGFTEALGIDLLEVSAVTETPGNNPVIDDLRFGQVVIDTSNDPIPMEWKTVGNAGNPADSTGFGRVTANYRITKHEITNIQYVEFLNAVAAADPRGLFVPVNEVRTGITRTGSSGSYVYAVKKNMANKPVNYVSFFDAARMANWMHNGKGSGSTESGAYNMAAAQPQRQAGAKFFIPTENEWYKAAYYDPTPGAGGGDNYWLYAPRSNALPAQAQSNGSGTISNPGPNIANYDSGAFWNGARGNLTTIGSAGSASDSYYGTADQSGNLIEWTETLVNGTNRIFRGGSWSLPGSFLPATRRMENASEDENDGIGFRLGSPAPTVGIAISGSASQPEDQAGAITMVVSRSGDTDQALTVHLAVTGTAIAGSDYLLGGSDVTMVSIPIGAATASITITPAVDNLDETHETVTVTLQAGEAYNLASGRAATATILDDDFTPIALADAAYELVEDSNLQVLPQGGVLANDTDEDDGKGPDHLTAELVSTTAHGTLELFPKGDFSYMPAANYFGPDSFTYRASDGSNLSAVVTASITVKEQADLHLTAVASPLVVGAPGTEIHTFTLTNAGPSNATSAVVDFQSVLPAGVTAGAPEVSTGTVAGGRWSLNLAEHGQATLAIRYAVPASAPGGVANLVTSAAVVSADQPLGTTSDDAAQTASGIVSPAGLDRTLVTPLPAIARQLGLFIQRVVITNGNPLPIEGFRLLIGGLPADAQVHNRHGMEGSLAYIDFAGTIAPGGQVTLTIEFFQAGRGGIPITPAYSIASVFAVVQPEPGLAGSGASPTRVLSLANRDVLIEFDSTAGQDYAIEYSPDMSRWHRVIPSITASANRTQWIDSGPPKTTSHPSAAPRRYYRVVPLAQEE